MLTAILTGAGLNIWMAHEVFMLLANLVKSLFNLFKAALTFY